MIAKYDNEPIELTSWFIDALKNLMRAEMRMMQEYNPEDADLWTWGICTIGDVSNSNCFSFSYGREEDRPEGLIGDVWVKTES